MYINFIPQGVVAAAPLAFIIPAACVMRLRQEAIFSRRNIAPMLLMAFGIIVAVVGFIMAVFNMIHGSSCSHGREPAYCQSTANGTHHEASTLMTPSGLSPAKTELQPLINT